MPSQPLTIGDFSVLPISMPPSPSYPKPTTHQLYVRRNTPKIPTPNDSRSLFITNVPIDSTEAHFRALFASLVGAGRFESITFEPENRKDAAHRLSSSSNPSSLLDAAVPVSSTRLLQAHSASNNNKKRKASELETNSDETLNSILLPQTWTRNLHPSGSSATVLLADSNSVTQVLKAISKLSTSKSKTIPPTWPASLPSVKPLGISLIKSHNRLRYPSPHKLQQSVDAFSAFFAAKEKEANEIAKRLRSLPDEDGFVTVTRGGGRNAPASKTEAEEAKKKMLEKAERKKEELAVANFYRFQLREKKKEEQGELLKRFDEDRKKLEAMREKRGKFVPES
ncbi:ribosomal RNA-processing protein 7-domain-containing protein [Podospora fimiseda]|uniref:Ribosomal RNA-processing protein 7-domain-containing protein n=1 Tax=Podospora fimiseda TaxID=252190 RepID=A0AAN6YN82_9PEZI|nr:ribosomal RNA-processing protein 7-domain-containing protein [Podospora fimiseda]